MSVNSLIVLPCRAESQRLKEKHLIELPNGKTMFQMTYEQCIQSTASKVVIATDDDRIFQRALHFTSDVILTSSSHMTGSERVAEAASVYPDYDVVLNIQGDEPLVSHETINAIITGITHAHDGVVMCTAMKKFDSRAAVANPNNVKVVFDNTMKALYFSRSPIPFDRSATLSPTERQIGIYYKHLGLYAYKRNFLMHFPTLNQTMCETSESLEQLRILENGYSIQMIETEHDSIGIDTQGDLEKLLKILHKT